MALGLALRVNQVAGEENPAVLRTLAVAFAANGDFKKAIDAAGRGVKLAETSDNQSLADDLRRYIDMFKANQAP
jgi:hypothetical protein